MPFERKLKALGFPNWESFNPEDTYQLQTLIVWLEDRKIRWLVPEERVPLRTTDENWDHHFMEYQRSVELSRVVGLEAAMNERLLMLDELLALAISLEYEDGADKYKLQKNSSRKAAAASDEMDTTTTSTVPTNTMKTDADSVEFAAVVKQLGDLLGVPPHDDNAIRLNAVCTLLESLAAKVQSNKTQKQQQQQQEQPNVDISSFPLGFDTHDAVVNRAATILRLLYVRDLRQVQSSVNEIIVALQQYTANPKTDARLGKVGV